MISLYPGGPYGIIMNTAHDISALLYKANNGDPHAQTDLGLAYMNGDGIPRDISRAVRWLSKLRRTAIITRPGNRREAYETSRNDLREMVNRGGR